MISATTLVVDDESMVRLLVRRMLEPDVCVVIEAEDGESALRVIERGRPEIDVLLTDLVMPGIDGFDLVNVLSRHRPDLPVVCMSGFASTGRDLAVPFVPKPFSIDTLRSALEPALLHSREVRHHVEAGHDRAALERANSQRRRRVSGASPAAAIDLVAVALELRRHRAGPPGPN